MCYLLTQVCSISALLYTYAGVLYVDSGVGTDSVCGTAGMVLPRSTGRGLTGGSGLTAHARATRACKPGSGSATDLCTLLTRGSIKKHKYINTVANTYIVISEFQPDGFSRGTQHFRN